MMGAQTFVSNPLADVCAPPQVIVQIAAKFMIATISRRRNPPLNTFEPTPFYFFRLLPNDAALRRCRKPL